MNHTRLWMTAAVVLTCTAILAQEPEQPEEQPAEVLATVDGEEITSDDLWWYIEQTRGGDILDDFILRTLIAAEAEEEQVKVGTPEVDDAFAELRARYDSDAEFERWLHETGQTLKGLRMKLQRDIVVEKLLERRMGLTDEGVRRYYESHPEEFTKPPRVHLWDIVTLTLDDAFAARERLAAGEDFAAVAGEMSHDPTAEKGGDRGWITPDDVLEETVREVVFEMEEGEVSDPVDCGDHFHVFLAKEVEPEQLIEFEQARAKVVERIRERKGISEELFLALLKRRAEIDVSWSAHDYLNEVYADLRRIKLVVDDQRIELAVRPMLLENSHLLVPAKALFEAMGAELSWNEQTSILEVSRDKRTIRLVKGLNIVAVGDEEREMKEPARVEDGVMMISPRAPVEALGGSLVWNRAANTLYVDSHTDEAIEQLDELP